MGLNQKIQHRRGFSKLNLAAFNILLMMIGNRSGVAPAAVKAIDLPNPSES
jgi:hypothetical protein